MTFRKKLKASLVYPALLSVLVTCMLIFLMTYVVPKFGELYATISTEKQLPALTLFMLAVGQNLQKLVLSLQSSSVRCCRWFLALEELG